MYLLCRNLPLSGLLVLGLLMMFLLWESRRWAKYKLDLWRKTATTLKREDWLRQEADRIRQEGGVILFPMPEAGALTGLCLRFGAGTKFHCFGDAQAELVALTEGFGCNLTFHPWREGRSPSREQVIERLRRDAPKRDRKLWHAVLHLPGNRYLLTGCGLLFLSLVLRQALYWRLLGSLCLMIGAIRRAFPLPKS